MMKKQRKLPHPFLSRFQQPGELRQQAPRREQQRLGVRRLRRQLEPRGEARRRGEEGARLVQPAERAVQLVEEPLAAAFRQPFAGQPQQAFEPVNADAFQE